ncbi:oligosaccharide flippase family protein [Bradyrhizobium sp. URHD0069]|uniref:oligosaccharide flippase family protein n=1 Tax=Bradyrhizobium sp. URHD0069 TaxID=1380355 RepID=UPI00068ACF2F|nr:oligosaccharide flippase family protein [Bradyrhizobium sp. URHD0069]
MGAKLLIERASWTLVDQGVVSFGNFLLNVLLARTLSEVDYGEFALFLGAIFILRNIDYSFISYPLSVRLCVTSDEERAGLLGNTILLTTALSLVLVVAMALGTTLLEVDNIRLPACLCYLCWQAQETSRRCLLADFRYRAAVAGDGIAYVGQALLIALLAWLDAITLPAALYIMSATFAIGALVHASKLRYAWPDLAETRLLAREYFSVGKWSFVNYQLVLARAQLFPWVLAAVAGTAATASLQAGLNIANMMNPIIMGIGNAIPQVAAHAHRTGGVISASRAAYGYVLFGLAPILVVSAAAVLMPELLLRTVYGPSSPYLAAAMGLQFLAVAGVLDYIAEMINKTLLGVQAGRLASAVNVVAVGVAAVLAFALIGTLGVLGACQALLIANLVRATGAVIAIAWLITDEKSRERARSGAVGSPGPANKVVGVPAEQ